MDKTISIANDFSKSPAGRYRHEGPNSGEKFREDVLVPALKNYAGTITVDLDGVVGYGSSFLEEAFGGLIRERGFRLQELKSRLKVKSSLKIRSDRVWRYMTDADRKTHR